MCIVAKPFFWVTSDLDQYLKVLLSDYPRLGSSRQACQTQNPAGSFICKRGGPTGRPFFHLVGELQPRSDRLMQMANLLAGPRPFWEPNRACERMTQIWQTDLNESESITSHSAGRGKNCCRRSFERLVERERWRQRR